MNDLWTFEPSPAVDSVFAATLAASGGESLVLRDADGLPVFTLRVEVDRSLSITPPLDSAWGMSVNLTVPEVSQGHGVGFEFDFGADHLCLSINKVPCFSDRLPGGPKSIRSVGALGDWTYPCIWPLSDQVPQPVVPADLYRGGADSAEDEAPLTLVLGAGAAAYLRNVAGRFVIVDPDPVFLQAAARALGATKGARVHYVHGMPVLASASRRSVTRVFFNALNRAERRTTSVREPGWLSYTAPAVTVEAIERAFGRATTILAGDADSVEMLRQDYAFKDAPLSELLVPFDAETSQWLSSLDFDRFRPIRRRTLQFAGLPGQAQGVMPSLSSEGLESLAAMPRPQDDPLLLLCSR